MSQIYENIINLLKQYNIAYKEYEHEAILSYEDAEKVKGRLGWCGVESKNVFMKGGDGGFYLFVTFEGEKVDFKMLKEVLGVKLSIASREDVEGVIECVPGCVAPFGFGDDVVVIVDRRIFEFSDYLFSPGVTTKTIQADVWDLKVVFENLKNRVVWV